MTMNDSEKLDRIIELLETLAPSCLPAGWYKATLLEVEQKTSTKSGKPFLKHRYKLELFPRDVYGYFHLQHYRPPVDEEHIGRLCNVRLVIDTYASQSHNLVQEVNLASED